MIKFFKKNKFINKFIVILLLFSFIIIKLNNNKLNVRAEPLFQSNVYIKINSINKDSVVFTFFNSANENLVYIYKIDLIDTKKNEVIKEFEAYTNLLLKENTLNTMVFKVNKLKEKNQYIIRITSKECLNGIKIKSIEFKFKTL
ncbi:hypothetical protein [Clostridium tarantellae]|uniref:Uncharacterized protein n=1 Tax=Clostridium tarantellae TaxID=39493 RepID=A0A6I1MVL5_9CLOT|nr:hypothetical protein [Clostridium tarantellae]MPQ44219.1 hypothetical protein [Clostridium tarantellae]